MFICMEELRNKYIYKCFCLKKLLKFVKICKKKNFNMSTFKYDAMIVNYLIIHDSDYLLYLQNSSVIPLEFPHTHKHTRVCIYIYVSTTANFFATFVIDESKK